LKLILAGAAAAGGGTMIVVAGLAMVVVRGMTGSGIELLLLPPPISAAAAARGAINCSLDSCFSMYCRYRSASAYFNLAIEPNSFFRWRRCSIPRRRGEGGERGGGEGGGERGGGGVSAIQSTSLLS